jgi:hypothetical protein
MGIALDSQGDLYVNDVIGCRVQKFSHDGKLLAVIGKQGDRPGNFVRPKHMAVDRSGNLYVVDNAFQNVQMFNDQAQMLMFFGGPGPHPGCMDMPAGICVSEADLDLFAQYVHPAFELQRLVIVTNNYGPWKINIYGLGQLKPGKTVADISTGRVQGLFGLTNDVPGTIAPDSLSRDTPATQPAEAGAPPATAPGASGGNKP